MWRGISRAWSVGANEMSKMAVCKLCRKAACGFWLWLGSLARFWLWEYRKYFALLCFQQPLSYKLLLFRFPNFHKHFYTLKRVREFCFFNLYKKYWFFAT